MIVCELLRSCPAGFNQPIRSRMIPPFHGHNPKDPQEGASLNLPPLGVSATNNGGDRLQCTCFGGWWPYPTTIHPSSINLWVNVGYSDVPCLLKSWSRIYGFWIPSLAMRCTGDYDSTIQPGKQGIITDPMEVGGPWFAALQMLILEWLQPVKCQN